jgi:hypothetical protein
MPGTKEEFTTTVHYIGQEFSPPNPSYEFVSGQIVSHDDFKQETYIYVTWKKTASDENGQWALWDYKENGTGK